MGICWRAGYRGYRGRRRRWQRASPCVCDFSAIKHARHNAVMIDAPSRLRSDRLPWAVRRIWPRLSADIVLGRIAYPIFLGTVCVLGDAQTRQLCETFSVRFIEHIIGRTGNMTWIVREAKFGRRIMLPEPLSLDSIEQLIGQTFLIILGPTVYPKRTQAQYTSTISRCTCNM